MEHYRCWDQWVIKIRTRRVSDTVFFKPKFIKNPFVTPTDAGIAASGKMAATIHTHIHPSMTKNIIQALKRLEDISQEAMDANKFAKNKPTSAPCRNKYCSGN